MLFLPFFCGSVYQAILSSTGLKISSLQPFIFCVMPRSPVVFEIFFNSSSTVPSKPLTILYSSLSLVPTLLSIFPYAPQFNCSKMSSVDISGLFIMIFNTPSACGGVCSGDIMQHYGIRKKLTQFL